MKTLLVRLKMAWYLLTAKRAVVYLPRLHDNHSFRSARIGDFAPQDWDSLAQLAEQCYLCSAAADAVRVAQIEAEIAEIIRDLQR